MAEYNEENTKGGKVGVAARKFVNSDTYRGISSALVGSAYESFGKAFDGGGYTPRGMRPDDSHMANWRNQGAKAQKRLEDRWYKSEFENFRKNHLEAYQKEQQDLVQDMGYLTNELKEGRWQQSDGSILELDYNVPEDRTKGQRLRSQVEAEAAGRFAEAQIRLNTVAAEKYANNPIIDGMIQQMMEHQTTALAGQFNQPGANAQQGRDLAERKGQAEIEYKQSLTRQADATTANLGTQGAKYKDTNAVFQAMNPGDAARYFTHNVDGKALFEEVGGDYIQQMEQITATEFIRSQKWDSQEAGLNSEAIQSYVASKRPNIYQRAMHEWMKQEYGEEVAAAASDGRPMMRELPAPDFKFDVDVNPDKKETKVLTDKWDALGHTVGNQAMAQDRDMTPEEAKEYVMEEWLPAAMNGEDIQQGGAYNKQFKGLTADEKNAAAAPYIQAVRDSLEKALKWLGTGEGTGGLTTEQKPRPMSRGRRRGKAMGELFEHAADIVTPDALFPNVGENLHPPDFRKQFPKKDEPKE
jgi:hypothetical protein